MNSLAQSIHAMEDLINELPKFIEKRILEFQKPGGKPYLPNPEVETSLFKGPNNITGVFNEAPISTADPRDWINRVKLFQEGNMEDYIEKFKALSALIPNQSEEQVLDMFLHGLQPDIKRWLHFLCPETCDRAMETLKTINPIHQVPAIVDGRFKLFESYFLKQQWYYEGAPVPEVQSPGRLGPELPGGCRWEYIPSADSGQSGIINKGWGGLGLLTEPKDFVYSLDNIPHDWLFLQCASVVHHGGAGTTAAGLKVAVQRLSEMLKTNLDKGVQRHEDEFRNRGNAFGSNTYPVKKVVSQLLINLVSYFGRLILLHDQ
ncbi:unnamed protein product [Lactuca saligna]|uniref:Retrotransposon gag domain-containing protein n=1 Tax=Lactuca saligna TaxID=75948 RepID=A0AA35YL08_LACSI|nr:unnamed protein product [Lactuca saligna]